MRNQICVTSGRIVGMPTTAVSQRTGNQYCNFNIATPGAKPDTPIVVPMVSFKLAAEYAGNLADGDPVIVQYSVGSNSYLDQQGEERTNLSVFADEIYNIGTPAPSVAVAMGSIEDDPRMHYTDQGVAQAFLRLKVANEWIRGDGEYGSNESVLTFTYTGDMAEQVAEHVAKGMWTAVGFHVASRSFDKKDGTKGYSAYLAGDWYEAESASTPGEKAFGAEPQAAPAPQSGAAFDPFAGDIPFE